jgi:catechol 2,3-dioxygenase-like lactoylglutathione lyase family enzyme
MPAIKSMVHFSIPVSDVERSTRFYAEIVGCRHLATVTHGTMAFLDDLRKNGIEITFEEDRQGGVVNGPRAYFHDPDGTVLEFIDLTSYAGAPA